MDIDKKDLALKPLNWVISKQRDLEQNFKFLDTVLLIPFSHTKNQLLYSHGFRKMNKPPIRCFLASFTIIFYLCLLDMQENIEGCFLQRKCICA